MTNIATISISEQLLQRARSCKISISKICREAVLEEVERREKEPHRFDLRDDR